MGGRQPEEVTASYVRLTKDPKGRDMVELKSADGKVLTIHFRYLNVDERAYAKALSAE